MDRRHFLQLLGASAAAGAFPLSIRKALAVPAHQHTGSIEDVEHIVFFMKENRAFDHYFGTLRGVRGFGDPHPARLSNGEKVWAQPGPKGPILPFRPDEPNLGDLFLEDVRHDWDSTHGAWRHGWYDSWIWKKGPATMAHMVRSDIPYHYALADAFTVCDAYHCSLLGPTEANRLYASTGWVGNNGRGGGPIVGNPSGTPGLGWMTYPERLEKAGVSWKIYQDVGHGLNVDKYPGSTRNPYIGNFGCNILLYFKAFEDAAPGSPLFQKAYMGTQAALGQSYLADLQHDVQSGLLPQVSWIAAPQAYSEHPNWPANYGAWYTAQVLDALTSNPEVWSKTVLFMMYDENDGYFDHVVPPTPPEGPSLGQSTVSTENTIFPGSYDHRRGPYGLGVRVPMFVISPWSKGGWVSSEVFDHTSLLRFVERRFGVRADNITPWRRAVCGDLTSTLDFATPDERAIPLPSTAVYAPTDRQWRHSSYKPKPPAKQQMPVQEPGRRPARPVPYELHVETKVTRTGVALTFRNTGSAAAAFNVRTRMHTPRCYTVGAGDKLHGSWKSAPDYALEVHGPNGFFRAVAGMVNDHPGEIELRYDPTHHTIELHMLPTQVVQLTIRDAYSHQIGIHTLQPGSIWKHSWPLEANQDWYDLDVRCPTRPAFRRQFAGHLETGENSATDPQFGPTT